VADLVFAKPFYHSFRPFPLPPTSKPQTLLAFLY